MGLINFLLLNFILLLFWLLGRYFVWILLFFLVVLIRLKKDIELFNLRGNFIVEKLDIVIVKKVNFNNFFIFLFVI